MGCLWEGAGKGCRGHCEEGWRLPRASSSLFQTAPVAPPQGTAKPCSLRQAPWGKFVWERAKLWGKKVWETAVKAWGESERRGGGAPRTTAEIALMQGVLWLALGYSAQERQRSDTRIQIHFWSLWVTASKTHLDKGENVHDHKHQRQEDIVKDLRN